MEKSNIKANTETPFDQNISYTFSVAVRKPHNI